jgi:tRNA (guanine37-N1)-methyltransferase
MESGLNQSIDYSKIIPKIKVKGISVPLAQTSDILAQLKGKILDVKGVKSVIKTDSLFNILLIDPNQNINEIIDTIGATEKQIGEYEVQTTVDHLNYQDILKVIFPKDIILPSSFETIGHVALLNLRPLHLPYKFLIGKAIIDTHKQIKSVVNKFDKLSNQFRTPALELVAGELNYETVVIEEKAKLFLNVEQVYFCSRLHFERSRVLSEVEQKSCIVDVFCGIGPFAIRAAKEKLCKVYANDLNPECFKYLEINIKKNKLDKRVEPFCMDGRDFINLAFEKVKTGEISKIDHFYMNLPALAIDFLDAFNSINYKTLPFSSFKIHVYCFQPKENLESEIIEKVKERIINVMNPIQKMIKFTNFNFVKNVSSKKSMLCVSFELNKGETQSIPDPQNNELMNSEQNLKKIKEKSETSN